MKSSRILPKIWVNVFTPWKKNKSHTKSRVMTWEQEGQTQLHKQASGRWMNQDEWGQHRQGSSW